MPRKPRMFVSGIPVHVVQRGNNRQPTFFDDQDYHYYEEVLSQGMKRYRAALHAYALMTNHVHLLITPEQENSIPRVFQHVGRMYVLYINRKYQRTGTLWEGRYKCSLVDADDYLLTCYYYIERNPVSAGIVMDAAQYPWSSYRCNALGQANSIITPHDLYMGLGSSDARRRHHYRSLFSKGISDHDSITLRKSLACNYPIGNNRFKEEIEKTLGRKIGYISSGRPTGSVY